MDRGVACIGMGEIGIDRRQRTVLHRQQLLVLALHRRCRRQALASYRRGGGGGGVFGRRVAARAILAKLLAFAGEPPPRVIALEANRFLFSK